LAPQPSHSRVLSVPEDHALRETWMRTGRNRYPYPRGLCMVSIVAGSFSPFCCQSCARPRGCVRPSSSVPARPGNRCQVLAFPCRMSRARQRTTSDGQGGSPKCRNPCYSGLITNAFRSVSDMLSHFRQSSSPVRVLVLSRNCRNWHHPQSSRSTPTTAYCG
jgi:hypothetical protein